MELRLVQLQMNCLEKSRANVMVGRVRFKARARATY